MSKSGNNNSRKFRMVDVLSLAVLWCGILVIVFLCLRPPWERQWRCYFQKSFGPMRWSPVGHGWLWQDAPPLNLLDMARANVAALAKETERQADYKESHSEYSPIRVRYPSGSYQNRDQFRIDTTRLVIECFVVVLLAGGLVAVASIHRRASRL